MATLTAPTSTTTSLDHPATPENDTRVALDLLRDRATTLAAEVGARHPRDPWARSAAIELVTALAPLVARPAPRGARVQDAGVVTLREIAVGLRHLGRLATAPHREVRTALDRVERTLATA